MRRFLPLVALLLAAAAVVAILLMRRSPERPAPAAVMDSDRGWDTRIDTDLEPGKLGFPRYRSPESLLDDFSNAMQVVVSTVEVSHYLSRYFACKSFREDSELACGRIDEHLNIREFMSCKEFRLIGLRNREAVRGGGAIEHCMREGEHFALKMGEPYDPKEEVVACSSVLPYYFGGDLEAYCGQVLKPAARHAGSNVTDMASCQAVYAYISGDAGRCPESGDRIDTLICREEALQLKALRENNPEAAAGTVYAPLLDRDASCDAVGREALEVYAATAAEFAANRRREARDRLAKGAGAEENLKKTP